MVSVARSSGRPAEGDVAEERRLNPRGIAEAIDR